MDKLLLLFNSNQGVSGLLASVCLLLTFQVLLKVGEFLWRLKKEKDQLSEATLSKLVSAMDENTKAIKKLEGEIQKLELTFAEFPKIKLDLKRLFSAVRIVAGSNWPSVREEIMKDFDLRGVQD